MSTFLFIYLLKNNMYILPMYGYISCPPNKLVHVIAYGKNIIEVLQHTAWLLYITVELFLFLKCIVFIQKGPFGSDSTFGLSVFE